MKIEITKEDKYYKIKGMDEIYDCKELLKAVISIVRVNFNITDNDLKPGEYY